MNLVSVVDGNVACPVTFLRLAGNPAIRIALASPRVALRVVEALDYSVAGVCEFPRCSFLSVSVRVPEQAGKIV